MATQPLESIAALTAHHLPNMDLAHKRALVLRYEGRRDRESATIEHNGPGWVQGYNPTCAAGPGGAINPIYDGWVYHNLCNAGGPCLSSQQWATSD